MSMRTYRKGAGGACSFSFSIWMGRAGEALRMSGLLWRANHFKLTISIQEEAECQKTA